MRSDGCWTCKLRRKKCHGSLPVCDACHVLHITCHRGEQRPEWLDNERKQAEMKTQIQCQVRQSRHRGLIKCSNPASSDSSSSNEAMAGNFGMFSMAAGPDTAERPSSAPQDERSVEHAKRSSLCNIGPESCSTSAKDLENKRTALSRSETVLATYYLETLLPFLFPFYRPSTLHGGKTWLLELMTSSSVSRQAILCQSSYHLSLSLQAAKSEEPWEAVLSRTGGAFSILQQALQVMEQPDVTVPTDRLAWLLASITQLQRFEVAIGSYQNCHSHHSAAVALFSRLTESASTATGLTPQARLREAFNRLGPSSWNLEGPSIMPPSAEHAAFRFSVSLLILDDIFASIISQKPAALREYHCCTTEDDGLIDMTGITGCDACVIRSLGDVAALDCWKQERKRAKNLNVAELVARAALIRRCLGVNAKQSTENEAEDSTTSAGSFLLGSSGRDVNIVRQQDLCNQVWTHAVLLYLSVIVCGWQPASTEVRISVSSIVRLLAQAPISPAVLRTLAWPICVAGCLAEPSDQRDFRVILDLVQPARMFGPLRKALEIMQSVWNENEGFPASERDLAACFRQHSELVLLA